MGGKRKNKREDAAEKALELTCRWLHGRKMMLDETVTADGLNTGMSLWSPGGKAEFEDEDFPSWDWTGEAVSREDAAYDMVEWLFSEDNAAVENTVEETVREVSPGRRRIEKKLTPVPKFKFSSLEEFILKAEASGEFAQGVGFNRQKDAMDRKERPTKEQIRRTLEAAQVVYLAHGVAAGGTPVMVSVRNYADDDPVCFPESGGWKSFAEIKRDLAAEIEKAYPSIAFPCRRAGTIRLAERNEEDKMYLRYSGEYEP